MTHLNMLSLPFASLSSWSCLCPLAFILPLVFIYALPTVWKTLFSLHHLFKTFSSSRLELNFPVLEKDLPDPLDQIQPTLLCLHWHNLSLICNAYNSCNFTLIFMITSFMCDTSAEFKLHEVKSYVSLYSLLYVKHQA